MGIDRSKVLHTAQLFSSKGQFDAAIKEWKKLSAETPGDGSIHNSIGELHLKRSATGDAVASFLQAANAFRAEGATLKAIATYKKVLKLDPSRFEIYRPLGDLNAERGLLSSAVQDYLTLGKHYLKEGKTKEALEIYKRIVSQDPSNFDAQQRVAELCLQENRQDEATSVYLQLGRERSAQQRYVEAKEAYQSVLRIDPNNSEAKQFIEHFEKTGGALTRISTLSTGSACDSGESFDLLAEASRRIEEKQFAGAEAILNQLLTQDPGNPQVCQLLARLHLMQGQLQVALGEYRFLAGAALRARDYPQAEKLIAEFLDVEPETVSLLELRGELYEEQGDIEAAVNNYGRAAEFLIKHPEPGMPTLPVELFEKARSLSPDSEIVKALGDLLHGGPATSQRSAEGESVPQASATAGERNETSPGQDPAPTTPEPLASCFRENGPQAVENGNPRVGVDNPQTDDQSLRTSAHSYPAANTTDQTETVAERFRQFKEAGEWLQAEEWLGSIVSAEPDNAEARDCLGQVLEAKGDGAGAALQYASALELLAADHGETADDKFRALLEKVRDLAPASPILAKWASTVGALPEELTPPDAIAPESVDGLDPDVHYTLGIAYKNMGLFEEAREEFAHAMKGPEVFPDACLMTAVCLKEQEQYDAACTQLERLLIDPRCQGAKAQAIRYELGLLYEKQQRWQLATTMFETIPSFHDVPERLASIRAMSKPARPPAAETFRYTN